MKSRIEAIASLIVTALFIVNSVLTASGKNPIPYDEDSVYMTISNVLTGISVLYVWYKNQNLTVEAQTAQDLLDEMKADRNEPDGSNDDPEGVEEE